jgi:phosphatidylethanolamine-binding protein (PEBP) family uncharacterized protein
MGAGAYFGVFSKLPLDVAALGLPPGVKAPILARALTGHVLAEARYMGRYERQ